MKYEVCWCNKNLMAEINSIHLFQSCVLDIIAQGFLYVFHCLHQTLLILGRRSEKTNFRLACQKGNQLYSLC